MTLYMLYNEGTPEKARLEDLAARLEAFQLTAELLDADSPRGVDLAETYDVLARPAVLLMRDDGTPLQIWAGIDDLPTPSDISYLMHQ